VAPSGDIYVSDGYGGTSVHRFGADCALKKTWGRPGKGPGEFSIPHGIWVVPDGRVAVGDREHNRVQIFDPDGNYLSELTGFFHPMCIYGDDAGVLYVSDQVPRLVAIKPDGTRVGSCRPVLNGGHGIFEDSRGNFYLAEMNPNRITRLSLL
jgi:peptidylglycine monooxygenase